MATSSPPIDWLQQRRHKAWQLKQHGWRHGAIAEALGVTNQTIEQWFEQHATIQPKISVPTTTLLEEQRQHLLTLLRRLPSDFGFPDARWTPEQVGLLIQQLFDVTLQDDALERILQWLMVQPEDRNQTKPTGTEHAVQRVRFKKQHRIRKLQMWALDHQKQTVLPLAQQPETADESGASPRATPDNHETALAHTRFKPGPPTKLTLEQLQTLPGVLLKPPHAYGLHGNVWTYKQIALVIEQVYQVSFSPDYIPDFLKRARRRLEKLSRHMEQK